MFIFFLYFFKNIFKFYQLGFVNVSKFIQCFGFHEILFAILI